MGVFISYARRDADVTASLHEDLVRATLEVWFDRDLQGGQRWWEAILEQIAACDVFLFVLSPDSIRSRACRAELAYAVALGRPVLPVQVRDVNVDLAPDPIGSTQLVDYREPSRQSAIALVVAVGQLPDPPPLPDPLPPSPPPPMTDLGPLRDRIAAATLSFDDQQAIVAEMGRRIDEVDQHETLLRLMEQMRSRPDIVETVARQLVELMKAVPRADDDVSESASPVHRTPLSERDPDTVALLRSLVTHIRKQQFTPILGMGLTDALIGSRRHLARQWAKTFEYPMAKHQQDDLPNVAQFVTVMTNTETLRSSLDEYLRGRMRELYPDLGDGADLGGMLRTAWERQRIDTTADTHVTLAGLPCPIYIVAQPWDLLTEALRAAGKSPVVELCRWRPEVYDWPASLFDSEPDYVPTVDRPLVFHVFGVLDFPDSLVITEDDYLEFLTAVAEHPSLIPPAVRRALADSALMLLGFGLEDWDVRVLLRTLVGQGGSARLRDYTHVAAQVDLSSGVVSPPRARRYLERYFGKFRRPSIDIYWGTVDEFAADLSELVAAVTR